MVASATTRSRWFPAVSSPAPEERRDEHLSRYGGEGSTRFFRPAPFRWWRAAPSTRPTTRGQRTTPRPRPTTATPVEPASSSRRSEAATAPSETRSCPTRPRRADTHRGPPGHRRAPELATTPTGPAPRAFRARPGRPSSRRRTSRRAACTSPVADARGTTSRATCAPRRPRRSASSSLPLSGTRPRAPSTRRRSATGSR